MGADNRSVQVFEQRLLPAVEQLIRLLIQLPDHIGGGLTVVMLVGGPETEVRTTRAGWQFQRVRAGQQIN